MKKEKIIFIFLPILCAIAAIVGYLNFINIESNKSEDSIKFKEEYEKYNNKKVSSDKNYPSLEISEKNPIKYSTYEEIIDVIKNQTGIIYLGFPECPWCRSIIPVLFDIVKDNDINTIYYLNIKNERSSYVVQDNKLVYEIDENGNEKKGTEDYHNLLKVLDKYLTEYTITYEDKTYETGEKRIYAPTVIFVKDGKILGVHVSTVSSHLSGYDKMTDEQTEELYSIYEDYILDIKSATCDIGTSC